MCEIKLIDNRVETSLSTHTLRPGGQGQHQPSPGPLSDIQHLESEYSNQQPMKAGDIILVTSQATDDGEGPRLVRFVSFTRKSSKNLSRYKNILSSKYNLRKNKQVLY